MNQDGEACFQEQVHLVRQEYVENSYDGETTVKQSDYLGKYIKVDGDKVYACSNQDEHANWQLIYNFSLERGEGCMMPATTQRYVPKGDDIIENRELYYKFVSYEPVEKYEDLAMLVKVFESEEDSTDESKAIASEYWLRGIGGLWNFTDPYYYYIGDGLLCSDSYMYLKKVTSNNGNIIAVYDKAGIEEVSAETTEVDAVYYDLSGRRVECPDRGIFIEKKGNQVRKVAL